VPEYPLIADPGLIGELQTAAIAERRRIDWGDDA